MARTPIAEHRYQGDPIKGSRFVATVAAASDQGQAQALIERVAAEFDDSRHVCWAWRLGADGEHMRSFDAGEPRGSAGRPILAQLEGHDVTDAVVVVVRYFGGVKLGVGGLMRAYGGAAGRCLDRAAMRELVATERLIIEHPYECAGAVEGLLAAYALAPAEARYDERVRLVLELPRSTLEAFRRELTDRTGGRASSSTSPRAVE
jgi:uncharacterized YigZ family protein